MVTISSLNGYGTYSPANVTIPASGSYSLSPLIFTPNPGFNGGDDYLVISVMGDSCVTLVPIDFEPFFAFKTMPQGTELLDNSMATLKVTPNPSEVLAAVSYNLGTEYQKAESIKIYAIDGRLVAEIDLKANSGHLPLDISRFPSGTYIISLQADGKTVLHQKLIKK